MHRPAPLPSQRLIPSRFPPVGLFDTVATPADLEAVLDLTGWTSDRLVRERLARLPESDWVFGRANASIVMAAFLHAAPEGGRFNGPDLSAWYAAEALPTAVAEVGHHLRREAVARGVAQMKRTYRSYAARLEGLYLSVSDSTLLAPSSYAASQVFGEERRSAGEDGLIYRSVRRTEGEIACAFRPRKVLDVVQADHYAITVRPDTPRIEARRLATPDP